MADAIKSPSRPQYCHDVSWNPLSYRWPSVIFNQHYGLPPLLDPQDLSWMEGIFRRLGTSSWPGYLRTPVFTPFAQAPGQCMSKLRREMSGGVSEVVGGMCKWKISLDVNHFAPSEITVKMQDGLLVVAGKHEERQDEHGYIARCFTRKYTLPGGVEAESLQSCLSSDGILTVEAPSAGIPLPADVNIPIQLEETVGGKQQDEPQTGVEAEAKPEAFEGETPEPSVSTEHPEGGQVTEPEQQTVSDVDPSREPQPQSNSGAAVVTIESGRERVGDPGEEDKEAAFQEATEGTERDGEESADKPQAPETPDTITSEQGQQAEVIQPRELEGEEGYTDPAVTEDEQSTFGQTQEVFTPQQVLQKEMDVDKM
ncbi:retinitis pigmentosa 1-like 1 protein [Sinocyclocheilus grahami]|uniref:retinitis pigmentosa 1-like 1 protein n=1 Tax=Sinocyclocheilus grahami TaxID=75366 RepID=UPI0007AC686C|nr:PREDICTED: retinitis pigmentosa 1-like 1 protein [Sinocyclocheilus grahami]